MKRALLIVALLCGLAAPAFAQNRFTLAIVQPTASLPAGHRMASCYTGVECRFLIAVSGGQFPYSFSIANGGSATVTNATAGQTCGVATQALTHVACGEFVWTNPQSNITPTVTVTDALSHTTNVTWTITVGTSGWRFIDDVNGSDTGGSSNGAIGSPWRTLGYAKANASANDKFYLRTGTYHTTSEMGSVSFSGTSRVGVDFSSFGTWICYPGDTCTIDEDSDATLYGTATVIVGGPSVFMMGFTVQNCKYFCFDGGGPNDNLGHTYYKNTFHDTFIQPTEAESNASVLMWEHANSGAAAAGSTVAENTAYNCGLVLKQYDLYRPIIQGNIFHDCNSGIEHKDGVSEFMDRANYLYNIDDPNIYSSGIDGNQNSGNAYNVYGEVAFNLIVMTQDYGVGVDEALMFGWMQNGCAGGGCGVEDAYRNTLVGTVTAYNIGSTDSIKYFTSNVIINGGSDTGGVALDTVSDGSKVVVSNSVTGTRTGGVVDQTYWTLTGSSRTTYCNTVCTRGHELNDAGAGTSGPPTRYPRILRRRGALRPDGVDLAFVMFAWQGGAL